MAGSNGWSNGWFTVWPSTCERPSRALDPRPLRRRRWVRAPACCGCGKSCSAGGSWWPGSALFRFFSFALCCCFERLCFCFLCFFPEVFFFGRFFLPQSWLIFVCFSPFCRCAFCLSGVGQPIFVHMEGWASAQVRSDQEANPGQLAASRGLLGPVAERE